MSIEKAELKKSILDSLAVEAVERRDALQIELRRLEGAAQALKQAREGVERDVFARLRRDVEEGKLDPEQQAQHVDRYVRTCVNYLQHLEKTVAVQLPTQQGRVDEATNVVVMLRQSSEAERQKVDAVREAVKEGVVAFGEEGGAEMVAAGEAGRPAGRPLGARPAPTLKMQRAMEEVAAGQVEKVPARRGRRKKVSGKDA